MAGTGRRSDSSEKLRDAEVLTTAARVFHDYGYASSSVQLIADELGILKGSLYYYTRSKEDLLYRILKQVHDDLTEILEEVRDSSAAPLDRVREYVRRQVEYATANLREIAIYYRDSDQLSAEHVETINAQRRAHYLFLRGIVEDGQAQGSVVAGDAAILADLVFGSFIWTYRWFDPSGRLDAGTVAEEAADFAVRAIRT